MNIKNLIFGSSSPEVKQKKSKKYKGTEDIVIVSDIKKGCILTSDGRFIKIIEVVPVCNFYLLSDIEQQNILYNFAAYLKIAPNNLQIKAVTQRNNIAEYIERMENFYHQEENAKCREMIADNIAEVVWLAGSIAVAWKFFIIFQFEQSMRIVDTTVDSIAERLENEFAIAKQYLENSGLQVIDHQNPDDFLLNLLFKHYNPTLSPNTNLTTDKVHEMTNLIHGQFSIESE